MRLPLVRRSRYDAMVEAATAAMTQGFRRMQEAAPQLVQEVLW